MEIAAMKRANLDTHNLLTTKTTHTQTMNDHRELARLRAPPPTRSRKSNHNLEPRHH
jgi:hypothetical protein